MKVVFRPQARLEILAARQWYDERASGLGAEFLRAVDAAVAWVARDPLAHRAIEDGLRRVLLRRFPYLLIYRVDGEEVVVLGCFHHRRDPTTIRAHGSS